jgi:hypothetical protein
MADEKLQAATTPAPVPGERPIAVVKSGRKNGGTKIENVPIAPARKSKLNLKSLNSTLIFVSTPLRNKYISAGTYHSMKAVGRIGTLSLIRNATGAVVTKVSSPTVR